MAENVLADATLRRASGTSSSALGGSRCVLEFHWIPSEFNWIVCEDIDWILLEIQ
jgi:hypothetical protein